MGIRSRSCIRVKSQIAQLIPEFWCSLDFLHSRSTWTIESHYLKELHIVEDDHSQTSSFFNIWRAAFPLASFLLRSCPCPIRSSSFSCKLISVCTISSLVTLFSLMKYPRWSQSSVSSRKGGSSRLSGVTIGDNRGLYILHTSSRFRFVSIRIAPAILSTKSPRGWKNQEFHEGTSADEFEPLKILQVKETTNSWKRNTCTKIDFIFNTLKIHCFVCHFQEKMWDAIFATFRKHVQAMYKFQVHQFFHTLGPFEPSSNLALTLVPWHQSTYSLTWDRSRLEQCWRCTSRLCLTADCAKLSLLTEADRKSVNSPGSIFGWEW